MDASSFKNVALFIKRAEEYQTEEYIMNAFASNQIGKVRSVKFIKKNDANGRSYNGVIVIFERWNMNSRVQTLFNDMSSSVDRTAKFYFEQHRYWIVNIHKQAIAECEETTMVDASLPDKEKIKQLEALVQSMSAQMYYMQTQQEKTEQSLMFYENKHTYHHLLNVDLHSQLAMKDIELGWEKKDYEKNAEELWNENQQLKSQLAGAIGNCSIKEEQRKQLQQELYEEKSILEYTQEQVEELKRKTE